MAPISILIVDDFQPWRQIACSVLQGRAGVRIVGEATNGLEAVQKAEELKPDLILLDISLPILDGLEAAKRILCAAPHTKILFVSVSHNAGIACAALNIGAHGYIIKHHAANELLPAIDAVLRGKQFVSSGLMI